VKRIRNIRIVTNWIRGPRFIASHESLHQANSIKGKVLTNNLRLAAHFLGKETHYRCRQNHHNRSDRKDEPLISESNGIFCKGDHNENDKKCEEYS
jgi:hypothetical protein